MKVTRVNDLKIIDIPKVEDRRGNLSVVEKDVVPFKIERVYYLSDVPSGSYRGGHAHKELSQLLIALSGSFDVVVKDFEKSEKRITLNNPSHGLLLTPGIWRELENFSSGAVCLVVASHVYNEHDYIRNYRNFVSYCKRVLNDRD